MAIRHYVVIGRVQGVGFRNYTRKKARELLVKGWVRNLSNGHVEALAEAEEETLNRFEVFLRRGPELAEVRELKMDQPEVAEVFQNEFEIR